MCAPDPSTTCPCLIDLPPELFIAICAFAECRTIVQCRSVCKRLREIIDTSLELQYRIELVQDGMMDEPVRPGSSNTTLQQVTMCDRLTRLRQLRQAWKTLSWTPCESVSIPELCYVHELVGGIFCKTQNGPKGSHSTGMHTTWLPGTDASARTVIRDLGILTRNFAIDPSQDLMVLFKFDGLDFGLELHIRTISANEVHPEARNPVLSMQVACPIRNESIQIVDDVVGVMYFSNLPNHSPRITVWNWKTGNLVVHSDYNDLPRGICDFSFMNSRALFVLTDTGGGSLELFSFICNQSESSRPGDTPSSRLIHATTLHLPSVLPSVRLQSVDTHAGPSLATCPPDKLFTASNEDRIRALTVQYIQSPMLNGPQMRPRVCFFLHNRVLEDYLKKGLDQGAGTDGSVIELPWIEWGPTHTRVLPFVDISGWSRRCIHGQRAVLLPRVFSEMGTSMLQVLDFNVRGPAYRRVSDGEHATQCKAGISDKGFIDYPTQILMPNIFVGVVESGLPYRNTLREVRDLYSGVMIDDERLIAVKGYRGYIEKIDVFTM